MKLSIITTVYQAEKDLPRLLDSMVSQKSQELEFFLIDNGCTDGSAAICAEYAARDNRFKILKLKENIGYIAARNLGLDIVDADYIGFCDSDDYLEPGGYDKAIEEIKSSHCDLYITSWRTIFSDHDIINNPPFANGLYDKNQIQSYLMPQFFGVINGKEMLRGFMWKQIFKKSVIGSLRFKEDIKPFEDMLFNAELVSQIKSLYVSNNIIYNYIVNQSSITSQLHNSIDIEREFDIAYRFYEYMSKLTNREDCITALSNRMLNMIVSIISISSRATPLLSEYRQLKLTGINQSFFNILKKAKPREKLYEILRILLLHKCFMPIIILAKIRE